MGNVRISQQGDNRWGIVQIVEGNGKFFFDGCVVFVLGLYPYAVGAGIGFEVEGGGGLEGTVGFEGEEVVVG